MKPKLIRLESLSPTPKNCKFADEKTAPPTLQMGSAVLKFCRWYFADRNFADGFCRWILQMAFSTCRHPALTLHRHNAVTLYHSKDYLNIMNCLIIHTLYPINTSTLYHVKESLNNMNSANYLTLYLDKT